VPITLPPISRRRFLQGSLAAAGALAFAPRGAFAAPAAEVDPHRLALLSDIHLVSRKATSQTARGVDMWANFVRVRAQVLALPARPAGVLVNGDCAFSRGNPEDYETLLDGIAPFRAAGLPVHLGLGNHDDRENIKKAIPADAKLAIGDLADHRVMRLELPRIDWYVLDSLEHTKQTPGLLGPAQLAWLAKSLDARPTRPAAVMLHHQPDVDPPISGLSDTPAFLELVRPRKQVKVILFGHTHVWKHYEEAGLHFVNLPTTAYVFEPAQPAGWVDAHIAPDGMKLQLRALDEQHPKHQEVLDLKWR
jgi:3',5'-cyclic AMP phosphodiesterase CpdA